MLKKAVLYLEGRPLRTKLMLLFAGLFTLLCVCISIAVYVTSSRDSLAQIRYSATQSFDQALTFVDNKVQAAIYASDVIIGNQDVLRVLDGAREGTADLGDEYRSMQRVWNMLINLQTKDVFNACLFVQDGFTYTKQGINFRSFDALRNDARYEGLLASIGQPVWFPPMYIQIEKNLERVICLMRVMRAQDDYGEVIGAQRIGILAEGIDDIVRKANITSSGLTYLVNSGGEIIATSAPLREFDYAGISPEKLSGGNDWGTLELSGTEHLIKSAPVTQTDWHMVSLVPTTDFQRLSQKFLPTLAAWLLPLLAVAIGLIWVISNSVTRRVSLLAGRMTRVVQSGDLTVKVPEGAQDEIGKLCGTFNYMVDNLREMAQEQYEQGKAIKQAELKALQAQINPHFLYNTLDLMNWMALDHEAPDLAELTRAMARFYKLSLGRGRDFVRLSEEVEHAVTYVQIQNSRFAGKVTCHVEVPDALNELEVLKLILQPLVENSVLHGLNGESGRDRVQITIYAELEEEDLLLRVRDNGIGMTQEEVEQLAGTDPEKQKGYGVRNIDMRLRLCYGERYGLSFESQKGEGTCVTLRMPARRIRR